MQRFIFVAIFFLLIALVISCGNDDDDENVTPAPQTQVSTALPTASPLPSATPEPTPTPLSMSDLGTEFRFFVNEVNDYAIQIPIDWQVTPRGAGSLDRILVTAPGLERLMGANYLPPLEFSIDVLDPDKGYSSIDDAMVDQSFGEEILSEADVEVNGLPARVVYSFDGVFGRERHYIVQRDDQFIRIHVYGYEQALLDPVLNSFDRPPELTRNTYEGVIRMLNDDLSTFELRLADGTEQYVRLFTDTALNPRGRLAGHIDPGDEITLEGVAGDTGELHARSIMLHTPEHDGSPAVAEFWRIGGLAGFQDKFSIFENGFATLNTGTEETIEISLSEEQWKQVKIYLSLFRPFAWQQDDNPDGADNLRLDLDFYGQGRFETVQENESEVAEYIQEILLQLSQ